MVLKDFECSCGIFEMSVNMDVVVMECPKCNKESKMVFLKAPTLSGVESWNPHYDEQVGHFFETAERKEKFLKETGRVQTDGPSSPRKSNNSSHICSKKEAQKVFG